MSTIVLLSAIMGILAVGFILYMFLPAVHNVAYVSDAWAGLPIGFLIMRDQMYEIVLALGVIFGIGVTAIYIFNNAGKVQ